ncbi:MAG: DNA polymerase III subunit alpha [Bacilli bacterium]|nr:DNA polymerase III subunit alpha [Bacilli bacterium]
MYVPLYLKTHYSLLNSMIKINDLINYAKKNNIQALTITDNNMYGVMEFYKACRANNIKPIVGMELSVNDLPFILYVKNYNGYKNLLKLASLEDKIDFQILKKYCSDFICIVPFKSFSIYDELSSIYEDIYKSYSNDEEFKALTGDNLVYAKEILYLEKSDNKFYKYLLAINNRISLDEIKYNEDNSFYVREEVNNSKIASSCNLEIKTIPNLLPKFVCPNGCNSFDYLKQLCKEGLIRIFGTTVHKIYIDRLKYELDIIHKMGFDDYFLIVYDYVKFAKEKNIMVAPGRGSAAGSLVSFLLNITTIDPIKYNLLFERFLNPERISMPDIDMDFDSERRGEVINYCINKYGKKKVAPIITFSTLKSKQVIKDVSRVLSVDVKIVDILSNMLDRSMGLIDNYNSNSKIKEYLEINPILKDVYEVSIKLENLKRQPSIHAAGVVMANVEIDEVIPLVKHEDIFITGYSMEYLEELGLLKMDFLGISFLTLISNTISEINKNYNMDLTFDSIPLDDKSVYEIFKKANTYGIFQFESSGMMNFLRKLKPNCFDDLVAAIALFRPGPMANIDTYIKRKEGKERITYIVNELEPILKSTYGIIIYQEQIMQIASNLAGFSLAEADLLRKAMSKKKEDILLKQKEKFLNGCVSNNIELSKANKIYDLILKFASYGFNKSHSVAYSMVAYKMAYLKKYYPEIFLKNLLTRFIGSSSKTKDYINECKKNGVSVLKPNINVSTLNYEFVNKSLIYPLSNIKNIGPIVATEIINERKKGLFKDIFDFTKRLYGKSVNTKVIESLILSGAFDGLDYNRKTLISNLDVILNYSELGDMFNSDEALKPVLNVIDEYTDSEKLQNEFDLFGFYLSSHPTISYKENDVNLSDVSIYFDKNIDIVLYAEKVKKIATKKGDTMVFVTGSDEYNTIDVTIFPNVLLAVIEVGDIIKFSGHVEKRFDRYQLVVSRYVKLN